MGLLARGRLHTGRRSLRWLRRGVVLSAPRLARPPSTMGLGLGLPILSGTAPNLRSRSRARSPLRQADQTRLRWRCRRCSKRSKLNSPPRLFIALAIAIGAQALGGGLGNTLTNIGNMISTVVIPNV